MYLIHSEEKSVVAERLIRTLKTKIYKYITSISKNVYIDKLNDIVKEYNNTYHRTIKMKPVDVKDNIYIDSMELWHSNDKDPKLVIIVINDLNGEEILEHFIKKNCKRLINKNLGYKK